MTTTLEDKEKVVKNATDAASQIPRPGLHSPVTTRRCFQCADSSLTQASAFFYFAAQAFSPASLGSAKLKAAPCVEMWGINTWGQPSAIRLWELVSKWPRLQPAGVMILSMLHTSSPQAPSALQLQLSTAVISKPFATFLPFFLI